MRIDQNKLVRDRVPEIIRARGARPITRQLDEEEYSQALLRKLVEEAVEAQFAKSAQVSQELADVLEVLEALVVALHLSWSELQGIKGQKRLTHGSFDQRLFLEFIEEA